MVRVLMPLLPFALLSMLLFGCGNDKSRPSGADDEQEPDTNEPQGVYLLTQSEGFQPAPQRRVQISFQEGQLGFSGGCNGHSASYSIVDDMLVVTHFGSTDIACETELHEMDDWLVSFLSSKPTITLSGHQLVISNDEATLTFVAREVADPDRPLVGTSWHIDGQFEGEFATTGKGHEADLVFNKDSTFVVEGPCNTFSGTFEHGEGTITVGQSSMTDAACEDPVEAHFELHLMVLFSPGENTYSITTNRLRLARGNSGVYALSAD